MERILKIIGSNQEISVDYKECTEISNSNIEPGISETAIILGQSNTCVVLSGTIRVTGQRCALKIQTNWQKCLPLRHEHGVLTHIQCTKRSLNKEGMCGTQELISRIPCVMIWIPLIEEMPSRSMQSISILGIERFHGTLWDIIDTMEVMNPMHRNSLKHSTEGRLLYQHIAREGLSALSECAQAAVIHRDISPSNFMWRHEHGLYVSPLKTDVTQHSNNNYTSYLTSTLVLIDFGCATIVKPMNINEKNKNRKQKRISLDKVGTPMYRSVRAELGQEQSYNDDIEAFGFLLYRLWEGKFPVELKEDCIPKQDLLLKFKKTVCQLDSTPSHLKLYFQACRQADTQSSILPNYDKLKDLFI
ncbi:MAG: casein kinase 1-like protein 5 [Sylvanvirus sp.]|uniref:Casein kinase 1-like protein 5 n=1 Tax=Sylvanvirus sp. TaxID=2487774 RepID=A0A3G5AIW1_9VIRU|nr:MAG: casein kinase 1-like protein 5 [Sylvanvirus sp.]